MLTIKLSKWQCPCQNGSGRFAGYPASLIPISDATPLFRAIPSFRCDTPLSSDPFFQVRHPPFRAIPPFGCVSHRQSAIISFSNAPAVVPTNPAGVAPPFEGLVSHYNYNNYIIPHLGGISIGISLTNGGAPPHFWGVVNYNII